MALIPFGFWDLGLDIVKTNLQLYLDASIPASYPGTGSTWFDLTSNSNNGTLDGFVSPPSYSSSDGGVFVFGGFSTQSWVFLGNPTSLNIAGDITLSVWLNSNSFAQNANGIFHKSVQYSLVFYPDGSNGQISWADSSVWSFPSFGFFGSFSTNTWYNITVKKDSSNVVSIYSNGSLVVSKSFGSAITTTSADLYFGSRFDNTFFDGKIGQGLIYNRALSEAEIIQNYNATKSRYGL